MSDSHQISLPDKPISMSIGALSKTLILFKRSCLKPQDFSSTDSLDLANKSHLKMFLFIIKKSPKTFQEELLLKQTLRLFPFFSKFDEKTSAALIQGFPEYFEYFYQSSGSTLYENGAEGDYLYIILTGTVFLLISKSGLMPSERHETHENQEKSPENRENPSQSPRNKSRSPYKSPMNRFFPEETARNSVENRNVFPQRPSILSKQSGFEAMCQESDRRSPSKIENSVQRVHKIINLKYPEYYIAQEIVAGESFGEIALISNSRRNEICVCKENCHFLRVNKKNYKKIMMMNHSKELRETTDFFAKFEIFSHWPRAKLSTFAKCFQKHEFQSNEVLYKENDESTFLYFIKEGEVEISKLIPCETPENEALKGNIAKQSIFDIKKFQLYNAYWQESFHKKNVKRTKLAILGPGNYFGEEEFLANSLRMSKAVVKARSLIYYIKNEFFSINVKAKATLEKIQHECQIKGEWRENLVRKGFDEERKRAKAQEKALSFHSEINDRTISNDFLGRTPFQSKLFIKAKKQVLRKRRELFEKHQNTQKNEKNEKNAKDEAVLARNPKEFAGKTRNKHKFRLDLTKLQRNELDQLLSNNNFLSTDNKTKSLKKTSTARFSYLFHENELSIQERMYNNKSNRLTTHEKSGENNLKSDETKRNISQNFKGKFERALEKLKMKRENINNINNNNSNINNNSSFFSKHNENDNGLTKNRLHKFIQMMFVGYKSKKQEEIIKNFPQNNKQIHSLQRENASNLYLYNNSFQRESCGANEKEKRSFTERESKFLNIHVEKIKRKKSQKTDASLNKGTCLRKRRAPKTIHRFLDEK